MFTKETVRKKAKELLKNALPQEFLFQGERAAALLGSSALWAEYKTIFLFLSMDSEINTRPLLEAALKEGKKVFVPRVEAKRLVFYRLSSPDGPWCKGPFGIREPAGNTEPAGAGDFPALILTPGLAFDREGNRLGRGGGYYDRFFANLDKDGRVYTALGLCMDFQIMERVPAGENDKKMRGILTQYDKNLF